MAKTLFVDRDLQLIGGETWRDSRMAISRVVVGEMVPRDRALARRTWAEPAVLRDRPNRTCSFNGLSRHNMQDANRILGTSFMWIFAFLRWTRSDLGLGDHHDGLIGAKEPQAMGKRAITTTSHLIDMGTALTEMAPWFGTIAAWAWAA
jgi:hypothetical protein